MSFSPPAGIAFYSGAELPLTQVAAGLGRVVAFLQNLHPGEPPLSLYHDWWQHDGLHFEKGRVTFGQLFKMVETPRAIIEATPEDHEVFVGVGPKDSSWYLRFRGEWDSGDQGLVGRFGVILSADEAAKFMGDVESVIGVQLVQQPSEGYYRRIKL